MRTLSVIGLVAVCMIMPLGMQAISLSELTTFSGEVSNDNAGFAVAGAGDINGDGFDDVVIGAADNDDGGASAGAAYILYGQSDQLSGGNLGTSALQFTGEQTTDWAGWSVNSAGDVNGDGYDDVLIGSLFNDDAGSNTGSAYLLYGQADTLSAASLSTAVQFTGETISDEAGRAVASAGDVNSDGYDDFLIGSSSNDDGGLSAGAVYLIYGQATPLTSISLSQAVQFTGETAGDQIGGAVASAGDVNGDGYDDILIGAIGTNVGSSDVGSAYLIYGQAVQLSSMSLSAAIEFQGESMGDTVGDSVAAGDVNGDGYDDIVIGASSHEEEGRQNSGSFFLIYGQADQLTSSNLSSAITFYGAEQDSIGDAVSVSDVDNDGFADLLVGGSSSDQNGADGGVVYFVYGQSEPFSNTDLAGSELIFTAEDAGDLAGSSVSITNDMNGDGFNDFLTGAYGDDRAGSAAGVVYLGYLYLDNDRDGSAGTEGLLGSGTDCDDDDSDVQEPQTFYEDLDNDSLGNPDETITTCSATPPDGYADNMNDTNDTIQNNGVEIDGDGIDNDGDGELDEANTTGENGTHPEYGELDPTDSKSYQSAIRSIKPARRGNILVRFRDNSVYRYRVFHKFDKRTFTLVRRVKKSAFILVLHPFGQHLALVNPFNGNVSDRQRIAKQRHQRHSIRIHDLLNDNRREVIITSQDKTGVVRISVIQLRLKATDRLQRLSVGLLEDAAIRPRKTLVDDDRISLLDANDNVLYTVLITTDYAMALE